MEKPQILLKHWVAHIEWSNKLLTYKLLTSNETHQNKYVFADLQTFYYKNPWLITSQVKGLCKNMSINWWGNVFLTLIFNWNLITYIGKTSKIQLKFWIAH